jgi:hypothetical protein
MAWLALLLLLLVTVIVVILSPLRRPRPTWSIGRRDELDELLAEKQKALRALMDLERERENGLIDEAAYGETRRQHLERAAWINRMLGELVEVTNQGTDEVAEPATLTELERAASGDERAR